MTQTNSKDHHIKTSKGIPMTAQAIIVGLLCGLVVWAILDKIQAESLHAIYMTEALVDLENKADESLAYFRRELYRHVISVRLIAMNHRVVSYVVNSSWTDDKADDILYYKKDTPVWMPEESFWRDILEPSHIILMDKNGISKEVYSVKEQKLPEVFYSINETIANHVNLQPHIVLIDAIPHLIVPEFVKDFMGDIHGMLMLVVPLDSNFPGIALHELTTDRSIVAIVDTSEKKVLASSFPDLLPPGESLGKVKQNYFITDRPFAELSAANLSLNFYALLPKKQVENVGLSAQQLGRNQRIVAAIAYITAFTVIIFLMSGRINRILKRIRVFSERALNIDGNVMKGGNQLLLLEDAVSQLIKSVMNMREEMRKSHEKKLQESNDLKGAVLDAALDCVVTFDEAGSILEFNHAAEHTFGYKLEQVIGKNIATLVPQRLREKYQQSIIKYMVKQVREPSSRRFEFSAVRSDGNEFSVELAICPLKLEGRRIYTAYMHDISLRKKAEEEIKSLAKFPGESPNPMLRVNYRGVIIYANDASESLLDYWGCGLGQTMPIYWQKLINDVMDAEENTDAEVICDDKIFSLSITPIAELCYANVYGRDVTAIRQAELISRQHQAELVHVCRLSTMGEMATGLAHELNQPLAAIMNYARGCIRRIESNISEPEALGDAMEQVYRQAERAGEIIKRLRGLVRKREPIRNVVDFNSIVHESVLFSEFETRKSNVRIVLDLSNEELLTDIDAVQIEQVILNLIRNGMDAMHEAETDQREIKISTSEQDKDMLVLAISDTGIGIDKEAELKLFHPFYSTKPNGMGMGLAISKTIVVNHGGHLSAKKNATIGTTFYLSLPLFKEAV